MGDSMFRRPRVRGKRRQIVASPGRRRHSKANLAMLTPPCIRCAEAGSQWNGGAGSRGCRLVRSGLKGNRELGAAIGCDPAGSSAAMGFGDGADDGEAEAAAFAT